MKWSHFHKLRSHLDRGRRIKQQGTDKNKYLVRITQIPNQISAEEELELQEFPPMKFPNLSGYAIRCWGYRGSIISHPNLENPTSSCIHPSTHNQETFGNRLPQPSKSIRYTSYGDTPELPPQYWVASRLSHQQLHKRDFDVGETQVFQNCNDKIVTTTPRSSTPRDTATTPKCQEAPRTMFSSQNHRNDSKIPADPRFFFCEI